MDDINKKSDREILEIVNQLRVAYKLKSTLRYNSKRNFRVHSESVAEHIFGLIFLAYYFLQVEPVGPSLDSEKVIRILFFHDFGEIKYGDIPTYIKTEQDEEREREAAKEIFMALPTSLQDGGYTYWHDYEEQKSPESHFAYALDKLEPLFELFDSINERTVRKLKISYDKHLKKHEAVGAYPVMKRFDDVITADMLKRGIFYK